MSKQKQRTQSKPPTVLESVQCLGSKSMRRLDDVEAQYNKFLSEGIDPDPGEMHAAAAIEQVRATYCLATVLARIHEKLDDISNGLPMAGKGCV